MPQDPIKVWKIRDNLYAPDTPEMRRLHPEGCVMLVQKPTYQETFEGVGKNIEIPCDDEGNPLDATLASDAPEPEVVEEPVDVPEPESDEEPDDEEDQPDMAIPI